MAPEKKESEQGQRSPGFRLLLSIIVISSLIGLVIVIHGLKTVRKDESPEKTSPGEYERLRDGGRKGRSLPFVPGRGDRKKIKRESVPTPEEMPVTTPGRKTAPKPKYTRKDFERYQKTHGDPAYFEENVRMQFELSPWLWEGSTPEEKEEKFEEFRESILKRAEESRHTGTQTGMGIGKKKRAKNWAGREDKRAGRKRSPKSPLIDNYAGDEDDPEEERRGPHYVPEEGEEGMLLD